jgi:hypothetical protein
MAELRTCIPNQQFQQMVIEAMMNEEVDDYVQLIVSLVEEISGEEEAMKDLLEIIGSYLPVEEGSE